MNDFLQQFLIESREFIVQATAGLLVLEQSPQDAERLDTVFRAFHTLKGGAGIVEFAAMESALHSTESLLMDARAGRRILNPSLIGDCLATLDQVSQWLDTLEQTGDLPVVSAPGAPVAQATPGFEDWAAALSARHPGARRHANCAFRFTPDADSFFKGDDPVAKISSLPQLSALEFEPINPWPSLDMFDPYTCNLAFSGLTATGSTEVTAYLHGLSGDCEVRSLDTTGSAAMPPELPEMARRLLQEQIAVLDVPESAGIEGRLASVGLTAANALRFCDLNQHAEHIARSAQQSLADHTPQALRGAIVQLLAPQSLGRIVAPQVPARAEGTLRTLRINAEQIDALVRLTGELTVAKNAIGHTAKLAQTQGDSAASLLRDHHAVLSRLIAQLQSAVIGMRVLPLRAVFQRFPRVVREMSTALSKPMQLKVEGEETEADKTIVEMLFEPLLHVIRNAIDHGVEDAEQRRSAGKPAVATILLRAARDGDHVLIDVTDDGRGIDVERVRRFAKDRGIASEEELRALTESEAIDLVFAPGFSTAARVTEISGRGVGMDAVRSAVERVGGHVSIASRFNSGTTVSFSLPFSVMMAQVMTVEAGGQIFGLPLDTVIETLSVPREALSGVGEARVMVHRNRTIPVLGLEAVLLRVDEQSSREEAAATIVIATAGGQLIGLHVDRLGERMEVILKPLEGILAGTPGIAGTTVLGDGRVLLVLDILEMLQ